MIDAEAYIALNAKQSKKSKVAFFTFLLILVAKLLTHT